MTNDEYKRYLRLERDMIECVSQIGFLKRLLGDCRHDAFDGAGYDWDAIERFLEDCLQGNEDSLLEIESDWRAMKVIDMKEKEILGIKE